MKIEKTITCIVCPMGCRIETSLEDGTMVMIQGSKCPRGIEYARNELMDPKRTLTTSILVRGGEWPLVSVRSSGPLPKGKLFQVLDLIKKTEAGAPVVPGDVLIENVLGTGVDIVATRRVGKRA